MLVRVNVFEVLLHASDCSGSVEHEANSRRSDWPVWIERGELPAEQCPICLPVLNRALGYANNEHMPVRIIEAGDGARAPIREMQLLLFFLLP
jgi:hypothetical protein